MSTPYIVSARKYRPSTFKSVVGQPALTSTLKNAIDSDRLAQAYLFCGPRGVGKTSCARIFAKTINCEHPTADGEACNECESCVAFNEGRSVNIVELDAASNNSVDNIRTLNEQVRIPPQIGRYRVFIIDEVHMLSVAAFNAFLKTLEEPPRYVIFILATTEKHKVIPTILSRCQIYDFHRITVGDISEHLGYVAAQEGIKSEPEALNVIARKADGAMRDALSIFDQVAASCHGNITYSGTIANLNVLDYEYHFRLVDAFLAGDVSTALLIYKEIRDAGFDSLTFINSLGEHIRDLLVAATPATVPLLEVSRDVAERYTAQSGKIKPRWAYKAMELISDCDLQYRTATNKQFLIEVTLIRLCQLVNPDTAASAPGRTSRPALQPLAAGEPIARYEAAKGAQQAQDTPQQPQPAQQPSQSAPASSAAQRQMKDTGKTMTHRQAPGHALRRPSTLRINEKKSESASTPQTAATDSHVVAPQQGAPDSAAPINQEALARAWQEFPKAYPREHIVASVISTSHPEATSTPGLFSVMVDNPVQKQALEESRELVPFLRNAVKNQNLRLEISIDTTDSRPKVLTQTELLKKMVSENANIARILRDMDARMVN